MIEKPLIERYRMVLGLLWSQTDNLDSAARSIEALLAFVPSTFSARRRLLKKEALQLILDIQEGNSAIREAVKEAGLMAQEEE